MACRDQINDYGAVQLQRQYGKKLPSETSIQKWLKKFLKGGNVPKQPGGGQLS
jgi:hypothetical protein